MTPAELKKIQLELGLSDADFATELEIRIPDWLSEYRSGTRNISAGVADRAEQLQDDWRYATLILEKKVRPQFEELVAEGDKPAKIALITQLDRDNLERWTVTRQETRLTLFKQIDKLAKAFFNEQQVEVISKVEFIKAPVGRPDEDPPRELSVLGVRVDAFSS